MGEKIIETPLEYSRTPEGEAFYRAMSKQGGAWGWPNDESARAFDKEYKKWEILRGFFGVFSIRNSLRVLMALITGSIFLYYSKSPHSKCELKKVLDLKDEVKRCAHEAVLKTKNPAVFQVLSDDLSLGCTWLEDIDEIGACVSGVQRSLIEAMRQKGLDEKDLCNLPPVRE